MITVWDPGICASHMTATVRVFVGMKNLRRIWSHFHKAGWWRECDSENYLKRAKPLQQLFVKEYDLLRLASFLDVMWLHFHMWNSQLGEHAISVILSMRLKIDDR